METQTTAITLNMPAVMHRKLCALAKIANRSPEWLMLFFAESDVVQCFDDRDLDSFLPCLDYESEREATEVAKAANAFEHRKPGNYIAERNEEDGKFNLTTKDELERAARHRIIQFPSERDDDAAIGES